MLISTWLMAWRNLWRQPRRTWLTAGALALGVALMIFSNAFSEGMMVRMVRDFTGAYMGHAQIHRAGYRREQEQAMVIRDWAALLAQARRLPSVEAAAPRAFAEGLAAIGDRSAGVTLLGADMTEERRLSHWHERLVHGRLPRAANEAVVGHKLAETMELEPGSPLVLTAPQTESGELSYERVTVTGVLYTGHGELDQAAVIVPLTSLQSWLASPGTVHQIAIRLKTDERTEAEVLAALAPLKRQGLELLSWHKLQPALAQMQGIMGFWMVIALAIIYGLISLGVINTMAMSLLERRREFGVLKAIGTPPGQLALMVAMEALSLGLLGTGVGLALGLGVTGLTAIHGMTMSQVEMMGMTFRDALFPILKPGMVVAVGAAFVALTPLAAVGLALRTALIDPITALRAQ